MTDTTASHEFIKGCSGFVHNFTMLSCIQTLMETIALPQPTREDLAFAAELTEKALQAFPGHDSEKPLHWEVKPYVGRCIPGGGSTDVSDVSWICPTAELTAATMAAGTPCHSWQLTAQGKTPYAHAMTRYAAKIMAGCAVQLMEDPALLEKAREEHRRQVGSGYVPPIPAGIAPRPMESFIKK